MKKVVLFVLGMMMIMSMVGGVAGVLTPTQTTQDATVKLTVNSDYQITIPSTFLIDSTTKTGDGQISIVMKSIAAYQNLTVTVKSSQYGLDTSSPNAWALYHQSGAEEDYAAYAMDISDTYSNHIGDDVTESPIKNNDRLIDIPATDNNGGVPITKYLHFKLIGDTTFSGDYSDTLTFDVSLTNTAAP